MKNFKFLSALALTGMLSAGIVGTSLAATDVPSKTLGVYKELVSRETVVPFVLANRDDYISKADMASKFNNVVAAEPVETGDEITVDGVKAKAIVYGDVNGDGKISMNDASLIQKYKANTYTLNDIELEAANVVRSDKSGVTMNDAGHIQQYIAGANAAHNFVIDQEPPEETISSNYEVTVNTNNIVNNENYNKKSTVKIKLKEANGSTPVKVTLKYVSKTDGKDYAIGASAQTFDIPAYAEGLDVEKVDFSKVPDGKDIVLRMYDDTISTKSVLVGEYKITKDTTTLPEAFEISTRRDGTRSAHLSFLGGDSEVVKVYYKINSTSTSKPNKDTLVSDTSVKSMTVSGNKLSDQLLDWSLSDNNDTAWKVHFVVENAIGNRSNVYEKIIAKNLPTVKQRYAVVEMKEPTLVKDQASDPSANTKFTWKVDTNEKSKPSSGTTYYIVTVYKDESKIGEVEVSTTEFDLATTTFPGLTDSKKLIEKYGAGNYSIRVVVKGDTKGEFTDSEPVYSGKVEVKNLNKPTELKYTINDTSSSSKPSVKIEWTPSYEKEKILGHEVSVLKYDDTEKDFIEDTSISAKQVTSGTNEATIPQIERNTIYKIAVKTKALADQYKEINSEDEYTEEFFALGVGTCAVSTDVDAIKAHSAKLTVTPVTGLPNKDIKYTIIVLDKTGKDGETESQYTERRVPIEVDANKATTDVVISDLIEDHVYAFKLEVQVGDAKGVTTRTADITTKKGAISINGLTVSSTVNAESIVASTTGLSIAGEKEIPTAELSKYENGTLLTNVCTFINGKVLVNGDKIVNIDDSSIKLELTSAGTGGTSTVKNRDFSNKFKDMNVELVGDNSIKKILISDCKQLTLSGDGALFDLSGISDTVKYNVILNGVEVTATASSNPVPVTINSNATLNGVTIKTSTATTIVANAQTLTITANEGTNNLEFTTNKGVELIFKGKDGFGSTQDGTIKITANGGTVKVSSTTMNVKSAITIDATDATSIEVGGAELAGAKNVTVTTTEEGVATTISAKTNLPAPVALSNIELRTYTSDELGKDLETTVSGLTPDKVQAFKDYIEAFGVTDVKGEDGKYITVKTGDTLEDVTITMPKGVSSTLIKGLK